MLLVCSVQNACYFEIFGNNITTDQLNIIIY